MIRKSKFVSYFNEADYSALKRASSQGKLGALKEYYRDEKTGEVTFITIAPKKLFEQLERVIDFGAITAPEALEKS